MEVVPPLNMLVVVMVVRDAIPVLPSQKWLLLVKPLQLILVMPLM
jgi:hypothetical protein